MTTIERACADANPRRDRPTTKQNDEPPFTPHAQHHQADKSDQPERNVKRCNVEKTYVNRVVKCLFEFCSCVFEVMPDNCVQHLSSRSGREVWEKRKENDTTRNERCNEWPSPPIF